MTTSRSTTEVEAAHVEANREEADRSRTPAYSTPRVYVDNPRTTSHRTTMEEAEDNPNTFEGEVTTGRSYETQSLARELSNIETLYTGARQEIRAARAIQQADIQISDGQALQQFVANILEDQNTKNPATALLVALANAATARIDWADVAEQLSEDL